MTKTRTVVWLEDQTGQSLEPSLRGQDRHLSLWLPAERHSQLFKLAEKLGESAPILARRFLEHALESAEDGIRPG